MKDTINNVSSPANWITITPEQLQFWTAWSLYPERPIDNSCLRVEWHVDLDLAAFERALEALVAATDSLRLRFGTFGERVYQQVDDQITAKLEIADFAIGSNPVDLATEWLDGICGRPRDLRHGTFSTALARCGENHWIWQLSQHHIASDYYSNWLIVDRLDHIYNHILATGQIPDEIYPSFIEFAASQPQAALDRTDGADGSEADPIDICPILERGKRKSFSGSTRMLRTDIHLDSQWVQGARRALDLPPDGRIALLQQRMFNYALSATVALCARLSGASDVSVGIPSHNRHVAGSEDLTGLLMRVLPVHYTLEDTPRLEDVYQLVTEQTRNVLNMARMGERIAWRPYSVVLNYLTANLPDFAGSPTVELSNSRVADSVGLDLSVRVRLTGPEDGIHISLDMNEDVARELGLEATASAYVRCLEALLKMPEARLDRISLAKDEAVQLARDQTKAAIAVPAPQYPTFVDGFMSRVRQDPEAVAVFDPSRSMTYAGLEQQSRAVAAALRARDIGQGATVALCLTRSVDLVVAMLGVLRSGAAFSVLDMDLPAERREAITAAMRPALFIGASDQIKLGITTVKGVGINSLILEGRDLTAPLPVIQPEWPMYAMFTSGTTGVPKGIIVPHGSFARYLSWANSVAGADQPWTWALASTASFEIAYRAFISLVSGGAVAVYPSSGGIGAMSLVEAITADQVDFIALTPSQLRLLVRRKWAVSRLSTLVVIGELLSTKLALRARNAFGPNVKIQNWYGPTETVMATAMHQFDPATDTGVCVPVGRAAPDSTLHVLDAGLNPVPNGMPGEIFIGGNRMSLGYMDRPDLNRSAFIADPFNNEGKLFRTGDIGWFDANGNLFVHGRADDQIKIRGVRFDRAEIELALQKHPQIAECAIVVSGTEEPALICFYVADAPISLAELRAELAKYMAPTGVPAQFHAVASLPLTANGKTDRRALEKLHRAAVAAPSEPHSEAIGDFTRIEARLAEIWCGILEIQTLDRFDNFFDLGGDSLLILRMLLEAEDAFQIRIASDRLDQVTTIGQLAALVEQLDTKEGIVAPDPDAEYPRQGTTTPCVNTEDIFRKFEMAVANWQGEQLGQMLPVFGFNLQGALPPIFWCFNGAREPVEIAREIGKDQPIYAMRSLNGIVPNKSAKTLLSKDVAQIYADEIIRLQTQGPYFIGGNCQAGVIAESIARILLNRGQTVGLLCLLEHTPQMPYPGRVALSYGALSKDYNPFLRLGSPQIMWTHMHKDVVWDIIQGDHGQYFQPEYLPGLTQWLRSRLAEARLLVS